MMKLLGLSTRDQAATTATAMKTSLENKHLGDGDYFVIISSPEHPLSLAEHTAHGLVEAPFKAENIENETFTVVCSPCS